MIYIVGTPLVDPSEPEILKTFKNSTCHSLWRIWRAVWSLPEKVHVTSVYEFKSSRTKLLTLSGLTVLIRGSLWQFLISIIYYFGKHILKK